jgi:hypothetical protein
MVSHLIFETDTFRIQAISFTAAAIFFFLVQCKEEDTKTYFTTTNMHSSRHVVEIASVYNNISRAFPFITESLEIE